MPLSKNFSLNRTDAAPDAGNGGERPIVLVVDDEKAILMSLEFLLQRTYRVLTADNGEQALELLKAHDVSVIISDQRMPGMTGAELLTQAFMLNPDTVRIMITGYADIEDVIQAVNRGKIFSYIQKPWNPLDLEAIISTAVSHNQLLRERRALIAELQTANAELRRVNAELESRVEQRTRDLNLRNQQLEEANRTISDLARRDPLTGLANRRVLDEKLDREARRGIRNGRPLSAIILDLDHFKSINDTFGHALGDQILMAVGSILAAGVRPADLVARYGGEEFVILLPDTNLEAGAQTAERLRTQLATLTVAGCPRPITASFGVATLLPGQSADRLIERADVALYRAKANGRDRVEWQPDDAESVRGDL